MLCYNIAMFKQIPNHPRYKVNNVGIIINDKNKTMKLSVQRQGYLCIDSRHNGKRKCLMAHRAVALVFIPNPENKKEVNHLNGIKSDNRVENLEWATPGENVAHSYKIGLRNIEQYKKTARRNGVKRRKLTDEQALEILSSNKKRADLVKEYNVSPSTIDRIFQGKTYTKKLQDFFQ